MVDVLASTWQQCRLIHVQIIPQSPDEMNWAVSEEQVPQRREELDFAIAEIGGPLLHLGRGIPDRDPDGSFGWRR